MLKAEHVRDPAKDMQLCAIVTGAVARRERIATVVVVLNLLPDRVVVRGARSRCPEPSCFDNGCSMFKVLPCAFSFVEIVFSICQLSSIMIFNPKIRKKRPLSS